MRLAGGLGGTAAGAMAATGAVVAGTVVAAVVLLGGGSTPDGPSAHHPHGAATPARTPTPAGTTALVTLTNDVICPQRPRAVTAEQLKAFTAVTVVTCGDDERQYPNAGQWLVFVRRIATDGVAALQAAFELPSEPLGSPPATLPPGASYGCTADLVVVPPLILVDAAGKTLVPSSPQTSCGKPLPQVLTAERAITWHEVSVRKLRQLVTPQAQAAHCEMQWKNENWIAQEMSGRQSKGGPVFKGSPTALHVCIYRVSSKDLEVGDFKRALDIAGADAHALAAALEGPAPTGSCTPQRQFAVVQTRAGGWANVELGGCWRVARNYPNFATGSADRTAVIRLLRS